MKRSKAISIIASHLYELNVDHEECEKNAEYILSELEEAGMMPPHIPTGASGWDIGKGVPAFVHEWEKE